MAIKYIDYEGQAGTGDGSSFANRAKRLSDVTVAAGDEVRIKQSSNPTVLSTSGKVQKEPGCGNYNPSSYNNINVVYSTTTGQTYIDNLAGTYGSWVTGDIIVISYHTGSAGKNLNGAWRITVSSGDIYLDGFTASDTNAITSGSFKYTTATSNSVSFTGSAPVKILASTDAARSAWTASSNVTTSIAYDSSHSSWNQYGKWQVPTGSDEIQITSSASTGKVAYFALDSSTDLSSYQQISFYMQVVSGNRNYMSTQNQLSLRLCTDTQGDTSVHTINIRNGCSQSNMWVKILEDLGTNLNSGIQSVAIYLDATISSTIKFRIQHIIASKASSSADSITLASMIGLNTTADKIWWPVAYIVDRSDHWFVVLTTWPQARGADGWGYYGNYQQGWWSQTFTSTTIYKREQIFPYFIKELGAFSSNSDYDQLGGNAGQSGNPVTISGGWNSTDMSTRVGATFIRGSGNGYGIGYARNYYHYSYLYCDNFRYNIYIVSAGCSLDESGASCAGQTTLYVGGNNWAKCNSYAFGGYSWGIRHYLSQDTKNTNHQDFNFWWCASGQYNERAAYTSGTQNQHFGTIRTNGGASGFFIDSSVINCTWENTYVEFTNATYGIRMYDSSSTSKNNTWKNLYIWSSNYAFEVYSEGANFQIDNYQHTRYRNGSGTSNSHRIRFGQTYYSSYCCYTQRNSRLKINGGSVQSKLSAYGGSEIRSIGLVFDNTYDSSLKTSPVSLQSSSSSKYLAKDYDGTSGDMRNFFGRGYIYPETSTRHTASGYSWKFQPSSSGLANSLLLDIGKVIVNGGSLVSISVWTYNSSPSNPTGFIRIKQNADLGMTDNADAYTTNNSSNTWTKITASFTPSTAGIIEIQLGAHGGSGGHMFFDDVEVTQA